MADQVNPTLLRTSCIHPLTARVTLRAGQLYALGSVLGAISQGDETGKATLAVAAAQDGSAAPCFVLPYEVDATNNDVDAIVYRSADLNESLLLFGAGITADTARAGLNVLGITYG